MVVFQTPSEAYLSVIDDVYNRPDFITSPRSKMIREKVNYAFSVREPSSAPIITRDLDRNEKIRQYTEKEFELYASKTKWVEDFAKASKFWEKIANPDGTVNSAYGYLIWGKKSVGNPDHESPDASSGTMRTPWDWAKGSLLKDLDSRQAFLRVSLPEHQFFNNKDQVCTMHGMFMIRQERLYLTIVMRSCDCVKGLVYDMPWFCHIQQQMLDELKFTYSGLQLGTYTHIAHSLHIYEADAALIPKMIGV